jgi:hypothetical protein
MRQHDINQMGSSDGYREVRIILRVWALFIYGLAVINAGFNKQNSLISPISG